MHGLKDVVKVEYNDPHKHASKLHGFPFTLSTNTVGHLWESKRIGLLSNVNFKPGFDIYGYCLHALGTSTGSHHLLTQVKVHIYFYIHQRECIASNNSKFQDGPFVLVD